MKLTRGHNRVDELVATKRQLPQYNDTRQTRRINSLEADLSPETCGAVPSCPSGVHPVQYSKTKGQ